MENRVTIKKLIAWLDEWDGSLYATDPEVMNVMREEIGLSVIKVFPAASKDNKE